MPISPSERFRILRRDEFTCQYCGRKGKGVRLEVDHIIPVSAGGTDAPDNLVTACKECNIGKGGIPLDEKIPLLKESARKKREKDLDGRNTVRFRLTNRHVFWVVEQAKRSGVSKDAFMQALLEEVVLWAERNPDFQLNLGMHALGKRRNFLCLNLPLNEEFKLD